MAHVHYAVKTALILGILLLPSQAWGQGFCASRAEMVELFGKKYQEVTTAIGLTNTGGLVEVLTSPKGETWTLILTDPTGRACTISAGEWWQTKTRAIEKPRA